MLSSHFTADARNDEKEMGMYIKRWVVFSDKVHDSKYMRSNGYFLYTSLYIFIILPFWTMNGCASNENTSPAKYVSFILWFNDSIINYFLVARHAISKCWVKHSDGMTMLFGYTSNYKYVLSSMIAILKTRPSGKI